MLPIIPHYDIMRTTYTIKGSSHFGFILQQTVSTSSHNEQKNDTTANAMARHDAKCIFFSLMHTCNVMLFIFPTRQDVANSY